MRRRDKTYRVATVALENGKASRIEPDTVLVLQEDEAASYHNKRPRSIRAVFDRNDVSRIRSVLMSGREALWDSNHAWTMGSGVIVVDQTTDGSPLNALAEAPFQRVVVSEEDVAGLERLVA